MNPEQQEIIDEFALFETWAEKYQYLIELGHKMPIFSEELKTEENFVKGCQSQVWFHCQEQEGLLSFQGMSDSSIVHGLIALILRIYNNKSSQEILATKPECIKAIGLEQHLSAQRNNGLFAMLQHIRAKAQEHR